MAENDRVVLIGTYKKGQLAQRMRKVGGKRFGHW